jgi:ketosteroid isomerase-like protein
MDTATTETLATIERFNDAFNRHDVDAVMSLMTDDVRFENTSPPPDGEQHVGQAAVRTFWERFFAGSPRAHFEAEDIFASGDRCTVRWRYSWGDGSIRGVDVFRVKDGKVAEKLSYVKG